MDIEVFIYIYTCIYIHIHHILMVTQEYTYSYRWQKFIVMVFFAPLKVLSHCFLCTSEGYLSKLPQTKAILRRALIHKHDFPRITAMILNQVDKKC